LEYDPIAIVTQTKDANPANTNGFDPEIDEINLLIRSLAGRPENFGLR